MSIGKDFLISQLNDFKNTKKYTISDLLNFLYRYKCTKVVVESSINKFQTYLDKYPNIINKYLDESPMYRPIYNDSEFLIVEEIRNQHLDTFWAMDKALKQDVDNELTKITAAIIIKSLGTKNIIALIDYLIKYHIYIDEKILNKQIYKLKFFDETSTFTINRQDMNLSVAETYTLKEICEPNNRQGVILSINVNRINDKSKKLIGQNIIARKMKNKPYILEKNISYIE